MSNTAQNLLGCGDYRVFLQSKGGATVYAEVIPAELRYQRGKLDGISTATCKVAVPGNANDPCCVALSRMHPWSHELLITRSGSTAWVGPVGDPVWTTSDVTIPANDLFSWTERRLLPATRTFTNVDLGTMFATLFNDAFSRDASPNLTANPIATGILGSRDVHASQYTRAYDKLAEISRDGLDYVTIGRQVLIGGKEIPALQQWRLVTDHLHSPTIAESGKAMATEVTLTAASSGAAMTPIAAVAGGIDPSAGLVQQMFSESYAKDQASVTAAAQTHLDLLKNAPLIVRGFLDPSAPVQFANLIPGQRVDVRLQVGCKTVQQIMRLADVDVLVGYGEQGASEQITVTLTSLGTVGP